MSDHKSYMAATMSDHKSYMAATMSDHKSYMVATMSDHKSYMAAGDAWEDGSKPSWEPTLRKQSAIDYKMDLRFFSFERERIYQKHRLCRNESDCDGMNRSFVCAFLTLIDVAGSCSGWSDPAGVAQAV
jgi:hypothetical protein